MHFRDVTIRNQGGSQTIRDSFNETHHHEARRRTYGDILAEEEMKEKAKQELVDVKKRYEAIGFAVILVVALLWHAIKTVTG